MPAVVKEKVEHKVSRLAKVMNELVLENSTDCNPQGNDESEIILQLKEKFQATTKRSEQLQILTVLPLSWTRKRIKDEFGVSGT